MSQSEVGRKRAICETVSVDEVYGIEWTIHKFTSWAESKDQGYCFNSPNFRFYAPSLRRQLSFGVAVYPKGMESSSSTSNGGNDSSSSNREDSVGIFLVNNSEDSLFLKMKLQLLNKDKNPFRILETERKMDPNTDWGWKNTVLRSRLAADSANLLPEGGLVIVCDLTVLISSNSSVHYDGPSSVSKRVKSLETDLKALRMSARFSDFQIVCRGESIPVHKAILAARSDVFDAMLNQDIVETQLNRMLIEDFGPSEVKKFVSYLYSGKTSDFNPTPELLLLADKYNVKDLVEDCEVALLKSINIDNVVGMLSAASKVPNAKLLRKMSAIFIAKKFKKIKATAEWIRSSEENPEILRYVLDEFC